jgi:hypothetical protein
MAIAFDNSEQAEATSATSLTWAHVVTGSDPAMHVGSVDTDGLITGATYAAVSLGAAYGSISAASRITTGFAKGSVATGSNNVVISMSGTTSAIQAVSESLTGAAASQPSSFNTACGSGGTFAPSTTTVVNNEWTVSVARNNAGGATTGGAGTTIREDLTTHGVTGADSNGPVSIGVQALNFINGAATLWGGVIASFAPAAAAAGGYLLVKN